MSKRKSVLERGLPKRGKRRDPFSTRKRRGQKSMADAIAARAGGMGGRSRRRGKSGTPWWFDKFFNRASSYDPISDALSGRDETRREMARLREQEADQRMTGLDVGQPINAQNPLMSNEDTGGLSLRERIQALVRRLRGDV